MSNWIYSKKQEDGTIEDIHVGGSVFKPPKILYLEASGPQSTAPNLNIYQVYGPTMRQLRRMIKIPVRTHVEGPISTEERKKGLYRSNRWSLPTPTGLRLKAGFAFTSGDGVQLSPRVYSSRLASAALGFRGNARVGDPHGLTPFGANGEGQLKTTIQFAVDPTLSVRVLTGRELAEETIRNLAEDVANDYTTSRRLDRMASQLQEQLEALYTPPAYWSTQLDQDEITGDEEEIVEQVLSFTASTAGSGYFAVTYYDQSNPEVAETTDPWMITVDENGVIFATVDTSHVPMPEIA